jgi:hypothetical protein
MKEEMMARLEAMIPNNHEKMDAKVDSYQERMIPRWTPR